MRRSGLILLLVSAVTAALTAQSAYLPNRVHQTATRSQVDFEGMLADLATADVVFVGEQHDDPNTHRIELAILEGLARRRGHVVVSLEMFERDVQEPLDHFQMGHMAEEAFLAESRPWPRYATDYKAIVDFAISKSWPVIAANVPRPVAAEVSKAGLDVLADKPDDERGWFAADLDCPMGDDPYFTRFVEAMGDHPAGEDAEAMAEQRQMTEWFYLSQCLKDETMGESIARAWDSFAAAGPRPVVVHFNGAFHSDFRHGTVSRTERRLPGRRIAVIRVLPVDDLDRLPMEADDLERADYLVYTIGN